MKTIQELFDLSGKTAIVTGGAMGIGFGIVQRLAETGANVVIADLVDKPGYFCVKTDVGSEEDMVNLVKQTVERFGSLDIMVNNAGIFPSKLVMDMDLEFWEKTIHVNLRSVFLGSREAAKVMKYGGSIINIGSIDSIHPSMTGLAAYDASKHGVWGFSKNFALEVAPKNIRVNVIAPGGVNTEGVATMMAGADMKKVISDFAARVPLGRFGEPDDIATAALFLASDASSYMTGSIMVIDGGVLLK
ncbi:MAG: hypothetical protein A2846_02115 [Candidatus Doudnabacteria bacterium RIFCSPHIGHO2_01_FULL_49_9]|uniref:SDR family oxidoreductase n=1 Tax=Candidatus Doudnabacteria bacterium RIFCSPHIGHO2_01_FULL_49_9 TaxID=1817827 RepID=A0A1F5NZA1_9BACT|nr:MAG: hypothetical protein A2846_02115 [Candidatus Doudnabacteria bacterium RIFCSPHIGHO2_01_FULL_49_9]